MTLEIFFYSEVYSVFHLWNFLSYLKKYIHTDLLTYLLHELTDFHFIQWFIIHYNPADKEISL